MESRLFLLFVVAAGSLLQGCALFGQQNAVEADSGDATPVVIDPDLQRREVKAGNPQGGLLRWVQGDRALPVVTGRPAPKTKPRP